MVRLYYSFQCSSWSGHGINSMILLILSITSSMWVTYRWMPIISSAILIYLTVTLSPFLRNPASAGGAAVNFRMWWQFRILINSFNSAWIIEIILKTRTSLLIPDTGSYKQLLKNSIHKFCLLVFSLGENDSIRHLLSTHRSSQQRCSVKKDVLKNFSNIVGKHLSWRLFLIKLHA